MFHESIVSSNICIPINFPKDIQLYIKREDMIHPHISGNKYRKLRYIILDAKTKQYHQLLSFGGAFSNHIAALAYAGKMTGFKTIGIIRGDELQDKISENPTLKYAQSCGMQLKCISRDLYRNKMSTRYLKELETLFGKFYLIPEGGTSTLAVKGCEEILTEKDQHFDIICCSVGTGGTLSGLINSSKKHQFILGFSALKGSFLKKDIRTFVRNENWELITDYHFGGYAKITAELIYFINDFKQQTGIPLDPIYTGKMIYGITALIKAGYFKPRTKILAIHTGGLQGIAGMNIKLKKKKLPKII